MWSGRENKSKRLLTIYGFSEGAMEEGIFDVELVHRPIFGERESENSVDSGGLDYGAKGLCIVNSRLQRKTTKDPSRFIALKTVIQLMFVLKDSLVGDHARTGRTRNEIPSAVSVESRNFIKHSDMPIWILECATIGFGNGRKGSGMKIRTLKRLMKAAFPASGHGVVIGDESDGSRRGWRGRYVTSAGIPTAAEDAERGAQAQGRRPIQDQTRNQSEILGEWSVNGQTERKTRQK